MPDVSDALTAVLVVAATYGVTYISAESRILRRPREAIQSRFEHRWETRHPGGADPDEWQSSIAYLLSCMKCTSVWVSAAVTAATAAIIGAPAPVLLWAAGFGFVAWTHRDGGK